MIEDDRERPMDNQERLIKPNLGKKEDEVKRKIVWLLVSCLMVLSLVMASCTPAVVEEEEEEVVVEEEEEVIVEEEEEIVAPAAEKPKYGGVLKIAKSSDISDFDEVIGKPSSSTTMAITNENLWGGDWTRGPAGGYGTNENSWPTKIDIWEHKAGYIAESWEIPTKMEGDTCAVIYHIRKGIHWALNPASEASRLVGGRELTVDDVIFSMKQLITDKRAYLYSRNPELRVAKITSPAPWTVKVEFPWGAFASAISRFSGLVAIVPPEVVEEYGTMQKWKTSVGTGAFMLTDFLPGSSATMVRNPNYWMTDPIGPGKGNQLPYMGGVKFIIILDTSTRYAAFRTGKVDWIEDVPREDVTQLMNVTPQLVSKAEALMGGKGAGTTGAAMKVQKEPFNDIRVRRAMMMAIDFEEIRREYFGGEAQIVTWPIPYSKEYGSAYYGPEPTGEWPSDCPASIKELYTYNPEKAKELLTEAGYPEGFKTNIVIQNEVAIIDYFSIYKDMWSRVGIELELKPKEKAAYSVLDNTKGFDQMMNIVNCTAANLYQMRDIHGAGENPSEIDDPVFAEAYPKIQMAIITGRAEAHRLFREVMKQALEQAYAIPRLAGPQYTMWWPWLKNYNGEKGGNVATTNCFFSWVWLDKELKKSMGY